MDVLVIGADNPVGVVLQGAFVQWGRHQSLPLTTAASRWRSERQAKKAARKDRPDAVVDLRLAWQLAVGEPIQPIDLERSYWLGCFYNLLGSPEILFEINKNKVC